MPGESGASATLCDAITNGTFPQSDELLTSDLSIEIIPLLLHRISNIRRDISDEIKGTSQDDVGDVDQWMSQARKAQEDIARCKLESKRIVEEHQHIQALREEAADYQRKVELLEAEIGFTENLQEELGHVNTATQSLRAVKECLLKEDLCAAAAKLHELDGKGTSIVRSRPLTLMRDLTDELRLTTRVQLESKLNAQILIKREQQTTSIEILPSELEADATNSDVLLRALDQLGELQCSLEALTEKLRAFVLQPLRRASRQRLTAYKMEKHGMSLRLSGPTPSTILALDFVLDFIGLLHTLLSPTVQAVVVGEFLPDVMDVLVTDWLNPGLPTELSMIGGLDELQQRVSRIRDELRTFQWDGQKQLDDWIDQLPRTWLNKRKATTLDAVRKGFASSKGTLRQVERVERQTIHAVFEGQRDTAGDANDWDTTWDDEPKDKPTANEEPKPADDDDASGWGFEEDESGFSNDSPEVRSPKDDGSAGVDDDDTGEAWGWAEEGTEEKDLDKPASKAPDARVNGGKETEQQGTEITLTEFYSISEIPDHLIEIIGRDVADSESIQHTPHTSLDLSTASRGLLALPTLALAMFRATAPSYYGASPSLTDLHRYNDSRYIAERLRNMNVQAGMPSLEEDIRSMERFGRLAYSKEMETQRLIVWDLLEGAQGFTSCTQFPFSREISNAVSAVVDRIRILHQEWKPILSTSALMQSIGSLVTMVIAKVTSSIEEMEDISEPESQRLTSFCQQIASLEDLFLSSPPNADGGAVEPVPMTAVYVANWLKFQYLINILESSLVDIKYLWTEGELSLEFGADEVTELIKALFAESSHRKGAIAAIRGQRTSRQQATD